MRTRIVGVRAWLFHSSPKEFTDADAMDRVVLVRCVRVRCFGGGVGVAQRCRPIRRSRSVRQNGLRYVIRRHNAGGARRSDSHHLAPATTDPQRGTRTTSNIWRSTAPRTLCPVRSCPSSSRGHDVWPRPERVHEFQQTRINSRCRRSTRVAHQRHDVFADVVGRLSLLPTEIEKAERQIIQEERRRGLSRANARRFRQKHRAGRSTVRDRSAPR